MEQEAKSIEAEGREAAQALQEDQHDRKKTRGWQDTFLVKVGSILARSIPDCARMGSALGLADHYTGHDSLGSFVFVGGHHHNTPRD
jgi:hypothetical protein